jgi:hypothetical protein
VHKLTRRRIPSAHPFAGLVGFHRPHAESLATGYVVAFLVQLEKCLLDDDYFHVLTIMSITLQLGKDLQRETTMRPRILFQLQLRVKRPVRREP